MIFLANTFLAHAVHSRSFLSYRYTLGLILVIMIEDLRAGIFRSPYGSSLASSAPNALFPSFLRPGNLSHPL